MQKAFLGAHFRLVRPLTGHGANHVLSQILFYLVCGSIVQWQVAREMMCQLPWAAPLH
jgi:hypothetical protein